METQHLYKWLNDNDNGNDNENDFIAVTLHHLNSMYRNSKEMSFEEASKIYKA